MSSDNFPSCIVCRIMLYFMQIRGKCPRIDVKGKQREMRMPGGMELSSGERQRVYIARALAQQPDILLLDEPTSHLDVNFQVEICSLIAHLAHEEGITVLVVLHDLNLASRYCDELVLFSSGHVAL